MRQNKYEYDAFISHAVEDKIPIANELCAKLERAGLKIWYSGKELGIGDSIEKTIEKGLNRSRYGIVIFSPTYLAKNWTIREFYTLLAKEIKEQKVILPVLYNITLDELKNKDLLMADRFAVHADKGIDFVVERLAREIKKSNAVRPKQAWFSRIWFFLSLSLLANVTFLLKGAIFPNSRPMHQVSHSTDAGVLQLKEADNKTWMGEMQGLIKQINVCRCNHHEEKLQPAYRNTTFINAGAGSHSAAENFYQQDAAPANQSSNPPPGRKMTMAVVFQIETAPETTPDIGQKMDDLLNTISLREENDPFVKVTNREDSMNESKKQCSHTTHHAE